MHRVLAVISVGWLTIGCGCSAAESPIGETSALRLESVIPLGAVRGRIDHLAFDPARQRLYVAELGNDSLGVVDLKSGKVLRTVTGLHEPQGVVYVPQSDQVYVANGSDGSLSRFSGDTTALLGSQRLGSDADNVRLSPDQRRVLVGYGGGALAVIDAAHGTRLASIPLSAHPESFQVSADGQRAYINLPGAGEIATADLRSFAVQATWKTGALGSNFPMALSADGSQIWVVFRSPQRLASFATATGERTRTLETCGDSDDVFIDANQQRIYVICGSGAVDVYQRKGADVALAARVPTRSGARTGLFVPALHRLFVAARARGSEPAALLVYGTAED